MFGYQRNFNSEVEIIDSVEKLDAILRDNDITKRLKECHTYMEMGNKEAYAAVKRHLPMWLFSAASFDKTKKRKKDSTEGPEGCWRVQEAAHLNGLCVLDIDHIEDPQSLYDEKILPWISGEKTQRTEAWRILMAYVTPSGKGLKVVFTADPDFGNLADNQAQFSRLLGVKNDISIKDASRGQFAVHEGYVLYIDKEKLVNYNNVKFEEKYGEKYRQGDSQPTRPEFRDMESGRIGNGRSNGNGTGDDSVSTGDDNGNAPSNSIRLEDLKYGDIPVKELCRRYSERHRTPVEGDRHRSLVKVAGHIRYLVDNNAEKLKVALRALPWVSAWEQQEHNSGEIDDVARDVTKFKMWRELPKAIVELLGRDSGDAEDTEQRTLDARTRLIREDSAEIWSRLQPLLEDDPLYSLCTSHLPDSNKIAGIFVAGAMFDTLATRCTYLHYDGRQHRMNPNVIIIGNPASGKSFADELDDAIMAVMRAADEPGRKAEEEYKKEQKKRRTSNKAAKGEEQLKEPEEVIRYIPSRTSNAIFYRRQKNAKELVNGEVMPLHLYTFDSELDSSVTAQAGGSWIAKHDMELKAFHNEKTGVDYANSDSVNEIITVYWNQVSTGTDVSLAKKVNLRNINDGLCSRLAICRITEDEFKMIEKGNVKKLEKNFEEMKKWSLFFDGLKGEIIIPKLVEHVYKLCAKAAKVAYANNDRVLNYFRKRAVFYAVWFTIPRILAKTEIARQKNPKLNVMKPIIHQSDLDFAEVIFDSIIYYQDSFFGKMLEECWHNGQNAFVFRRQTRTSRNEQMFDNLPNEFTKEGVAKVLCISVRAAYYQIMRWKKRGIVESVDKNTFKKSTIL